MAPVFSGFRNHPASCPQHPCRPQVAPCSTSAEGPIDIEDLDSVCSDCPTRDTLKNSSRSTPPLTTTWRGRSKRRRGRGHQIREAHIFADQQALPRTDGANSRRSIYRRPLPDTVIAFNSEDGRKLFGEALAQGGLEGSYWSLSENFNTQMEPASCGPGTLAMVLNSLAIDPERKWKGVWRWFTEELLVECCFDHNQLETSGTTLTELAGCARCNGANVELNLTSDAGSSLESFREQLQHCTMQNSGKRLVVSFDRAALGQTGTGHFSSIGAYHPEEDKVLVMEVARFKYFPFWCSTEVMWEAMNSVDTQTGAARGFMLVSRGDGARGECSMDHDGQPGPHLCGDHHKHELPSQLSSQLCWREATDKFAELIQLQSRQSHLSIDTLEAHLSPRQSPWLSLWHRVNDVFCGDLNLNLMVRPKVQTLQVQEMLHPFKPLLAQTSTHSFLSRALPETDADKVDLAAMLMLGFALSLERRGACARSSGFGPALTSVSTGELDDLGPILR